MKQMIISADTPFDVNTKVTHGSSICWSWGGMYRVEKICVLISLYYPIVGERAHTCGGGYEQ